MVLNFKSIDSRCAARIRAVGKSYNKEKSLWERVKSSVSSFGNGIRNGGKTLIDLGREAAIALGQEAISGYNSVEKWMEQ